MRRHKNEEMVDWRTNMKLTDLRDAMLSVGIPVYHYVALKQDYPYIVWAETGEDDSQDADNRKVLQTIGGWIQYYTKTEYDPLFDEIQFALNGLDIGWSLFSVDYDAINSVISYQWDFSLVCGVGDGA